MVAGCAKGRRRCDGAGADASLEAHKVGRFNVSLSTADACFARGGGTWGRVSGWLLEHLVGYDAVVLNELFWLYRCDPTGAGLYSPSGSTGAAQGRREASSRAAPGGGSTGARRGRHGRMQGM